MGLFKDDDISGIDGLDLDAGALEGFGDDSIDKDLLNQIFADDGNNSDDETEDAQLDVGSEGFYIDGDTSGVPVDDASTGEAEEPVTGIDKEMPEEEIQEEVAEEEIPEEVPAKEEEIPEEPVKPEGIPAEEKTVEEPAPNTVVPISVNDDIVNNEAMKAMNEERLNGTVTVITENTTITGSISSDGSLEVMGTITGDIECVGKVYINGKVSGGVVASEIYVNTPKLNGGLISEGTVRIGVGTVVLGDVTGSSAYIAGAVRGNIDIEGPLVIESTAILKGDIKAKTITIKSGAVIDGYCSLYQTAVDMDKIFEE
ncbi:MAG: polymer-forming cytoskeletal protein [Lachnospiraceae bacterium]|nr:polymer-forming cytoskeletal protein [Lachnospiraceae bacterium]